MISNGITPVNKSQILRLISAVVISNTYVAVFSGCVLAVYDLVKVSISLRNAFILNLTSVCFLEFSLSLIIAESCAYYQLLSLNETLKNIARSCERETRIDPLTDHIVREVLIMYVKICDIFDEVQNFYLFLHILFIIWFFYYNIFLYYLIFIYLKNPNYYMLLLMSLATFIILFYWCFVFTSVRISSNLQNEACRMGNLIQIIETRNDSALRLKRSQIMSLLIAHRKPKISVGIFEMNWKSFFSILVLIYTFSIILVQFYDVRPSVNDGIS